MKFYKFAIKVVKGLLSVFILFNAKGKENIPKDGAFLLCANHHSNMDPVLIAAGCSRPLTFMAKEELFSVPLLGPLVKYLGAFPIKRGKGDAGAVMATLKILHRGEATLIFPEGKRIKRGTRIDINPGIIKLAMRSNVPILPAYVGRRNVIFSKPISYTQYMDEQQNDALMEDLAIKLMDTIYNIPTENREAVPCENN